MWLQHNLNASKTVNFLEHWKNFMGYVSLCKLSLKQNRFNKLQCLKWIVHVGSRYIYMYLNLVKNNVTRNGFLN